MTPLTPAELEARSARARDAAAAAARALGLDVRAPIVLHDVFSVVVHLAPAPVVARVPTVLPAGTTPSHLLARQQRELDVTTWLGERGVAVSLPSPLVPRAPVVHDGFAMTFWALAELAPDHHPYCAVDIAAVAGLHAALRDHPGHTLPFLSPVARSVPDSLEALAGHPELLAPEDLDRARREWEALAPVLSSAAAFTAAFPAASLQTIHGDAPTHNVLRTVDGVRFADFEDACLGPIEWDLANTGPEDLAAYDEAALRHGLRPHDPAVLAVMNTARMLQTVAAYALVPQLPLLAEGLAPALAAWREMPFAGGLAPPPR